MENYDIEPRITPEGLLSWANQVLARARQLQEKEPGITGMGKLIKRIQAESAFVKSLQDSTTALKENQLKSTNLTHMEGVLGRAKSLPDVRSVLHPFNYKKNNGAENTVIVDVVAHGGMSWVKVTARKASALHRLWKVGEGENGDQGVVEQAEQILRASHQNPVNYQPPSVSIFFYAGITQAIVDDLAKLGVKACGQIFPTFEDSLRLPLKELPILKDLEENPCTSQPAEEDCRKVNLDVTTLVALVSDLTNGGCQHDFAEPLIQQLALQERQRPLRAEMDKFLKGKELYACKTAITDFKGILETIAGPEEENRARELLSGVTEVNDDPSDRAKTIEETNRIKHRTKVIFGTGDKLKAITTSANTGFVRAVGNKGVSFAVHVHQSRPLTEKKRKSASEGHVSRHVSTPQYQHCEVSGKVTSSKSMPQLQKSWGKINHRSCSPSGMVKVF